MKALLLFLHPMKVKRILPNLALRNTPAFSRIWIIAFYVFPIFYLNPIQMTHSKAVICVAV